MMLAYILLMKYHHQWPLQVPSGSEDQLLKESDELTVLNASFVPTE